MQARLRCHRQRQGGFVVVSVIAQSLSCVRPFVTPWTAARQASLSFTISQSLLKLMSIESVMPSNHLCCTLSSCLQSTREDTFNLMLNISIRSFLLLTIRREGVRSLLIYFCILVQLYDTILASLLLFTCCCFYLSRMASLNDHSFCKLKPSVPALLQRGRLLGGANETLSFESCQ